MADRNIYEFDDFRLDPTEHLLLCAGNPVQLPSKVFRVLLVLVRNAGHLVEKSSLIAEVWGDTFVEESNLSVTISMLRKVLRDDRGEKRFIETITKQGYRFLPEVRTISPSEDEINEEFAVEHFAVPLPVPSPAWKPPAKRIPVGYLGLSSVLIGLTLISGIVFAFHPTAPKREKSDAKLGALTVVPNLHDMPHAKLATHIPEAHELYMEGRYFWNKRTEKGFRRSIECFQRAVLKDPSYADAYAGLADSYTLLASYGVEPSQLAYPHAKASAERALQLDDSLAEAHTSLGMVALYYEWDWRQADREFNRAIALNPNYPLAHLWDALYFSAMGENPQALQQAMLAQKLDPLSVMVNVELGRVYYWNRQYDKAVSNFRYAIELDPYFARAHTRLGMALAAQNDYAGAVYEFEQAGKLSSPDPYLDGLIGYAEALGGNRKLATKMLADLTDRSRHEYVPSFSMALLCLGLGDRDAAMGWVEKAYDDRSAFMVYAKVDPLLDTLRADQRFVALMKRMDLQEPRTGQESVSALRPDSIQADLR